MKICPICHKLSKDDDFCSHCGSAVYAEEDHSSSEQIKCTNFHTHEKRESFQRYDSARAERKTREKKKMTLFGFVKVMVIIWILFNVAEALLAALFAIVSSIV